MMRSFFGKPRPGRGQHASWPESTTPQPGHSVTVDYAAYPAMLLAAQFQAAGQTVRQEGSLVKAASREISVAPGIEKRGQRGSLHRVQVIEPGARTA